MAIEHPHPTESTVKNLYAHAFGCAFEGCRRPLYRVDDETGVRTLNSRVCHIHARREGGPRWDANQGGEENRSAKNLILMCIEHAAVIDITETLSSYSPDLLSRWKSQQLAEYERIQQGWIQDAEMAKEAIDASAGLKEIKIVNSKIELGGKGGNAPGAGGGGGGAIGNNARGGRGGRGGEHRIDDGKYTTSLPEKFSERIAISKTDGENSDVIPGAGGAGAGAIGDGATGGDGGDGGNSVSGVFDVSALKRDGFHHIEVIVGKGGENGGSGEDSVMNFRTEDGRLLKSVRALGGKGHGTKIPQGSVSVSDGDLASNFRVTTLAAANSIELRDGLIYTLGADWSRYGVQTLPCPVVWPIVYALRWSPCQWTDSRAIAVSVLRPDNHEAASQHSIVPKECGIWGEYRAAHSVSFTVDREGTWIVQIQSEQRVFSKIEINVALQQ